MKAYTMLIESSTSAKAFRVVDRCGQQLPTSDDRRRRRVIIRSFDDHTQERFHKEQLRYRTDR